MDLSDVLIALSAEPSLSSRQIITFAEDNNYKFSDIKKIVFKRVELKKNIILQALKNDKAQKIKSICTDSNIQILNFREKLYPELLKEVPDRPPLLYLRGDISLLADKYKVSIVGSRRPSSYGVSQAKKVSLGLSRSGATIVSGLAIGIDGLAHRACLEERGRTIGVLGTAIDRFYPASNENLIKAMIKRGGLVVSEYPPGYPTGKYNFPLRNRIIAGLSLATLVIEAASGSGSLITAGLALDYGREVFALPGNVDSLLSMGTNTLIKEGANAFTSYGDVLEDLGIQDANSDSQLEKSLSKSEQNIIETLKNGPASFDKIQNITKIDVVKLNELLVGLELKEFIEHYVSGDYALLTGKKN